MIQLTKRLFSRAAMTLLVMMLTTMTAGAETVTASYIKADGTTSSHSATVINQGNMPTEIGSDFTESWFVVTENVTYDQRIQISGDVHLILSDNTTLSVNGIQIDSGKSLTIYGQSVGDSKGSLCSTGNPGIGGDGCSVTINGGDISANGSYSKAGTIGIGGRWCDITINGGKVYAHGGESGTGIGCPWFAYVNQTGSVTINGGDIQAEVTEIKNMDGSYGSHSAPGICSENIYLNWKRGSDKIMASGCIFEEKDDPITEMHIVGNVVVAPGKTFYTENDNTKTYYSGTLTTEQKNGLGGKTLIPDVSTSFVTSNDGNTYTINDDYGWELFCDALQNNDKGFFDGKTVKLGADIEVTRMAGASYHDFTGTFDGQGHTLTVNYGTSDNPISEDNAAPFRYVLGCTIQNLHVTGHIYTSKKNAAGIAGTQYDDVSITNCLSSVIIHSSINDGGNNDGTHGGFVGNHGGGTLNITGCAFTGKMLTTNGTTRCGGFVGWCNSATNIINCLYAPAAIENGETEVGITENCTFGRYNKATVSLTNCYYTRTLGTAQGKQARSITVGDTYTTLSNISLSGNETSYNVSGITAYANGGIKRGSTLYYGNGDQVNLTLSHSDHANGTFQGYAANYEALSGDGNPYSLTMPDADVTIRTIWSGSPNFLTRGDGNGTSANPYKITNANDLRDLAIYVNGTGIYSNGITETTAHDCSGKYFKQTFDITLSGEWEPIGANNHQFMGIYDGDNNKISGLTVNGSYMYAGLFGYTHYKISSNYSCELKNIIVENCDIDVSGVASSSAGGIVGYGGDDTEVKNCRVSGTIKATTSAGGIAGYMWTVTNGNVSKINQCFTDVTVAATKKGKLLGEGTTNGIVDAVLNSKNSYYHDDGSGVTAFGNCDDITYSVPVYTVTGVPSGVTIDTEATVNNSGTNYYAAGNVTLTVTDASKIFDTFTVSGATYSVAGNKKSATVTLATSDATVSATLLSLTGSCGDNATWAVTDTNNDGTYETLRIFGTGAMESHPWTDLSYSCELTKVVIGDGVTSIGRRAFADCANLTSVTLPAGVEELGDDAFEGYNANLIIYVPLDEYENYCNSWPAYADIIQPIGAIPYIAADGTKQYCAEFIELTGSETSLAAGTYLVASDINFDHTVTLTGDVTLILADNCNMTIGSSDSRINNDGIDGYVDGTETWYDITIYGQTAGTGAVNVYVTGAENWAIGGKKLTINGGNITADANGDDACAIAANANLTINGGQVTATASGDAFALASNSDITINGGNVTATGTGSAYGITAKGNITISSGTVTATGGNDGYGICADYNVNINGGNVTISGYGGICANNGDITLGWTNATDRIYASSYYLTSGSGTVTIADGHKLYNGKGFLSGTVSTSAAVNGKTLQPALSTAYITAQGTAADDPADAIVLSPDQTTLGAHNYVALGTLNYTTGLTLTGNATLILADNCQMNVGASSNRIEGCGIAKSGKWSLTITSQSIGSDMGALSIYTTGPNNYAIYAKDVTINGGNITADTNTDYCPAVTADDNITINGGTVNANTTGNEAHAFYSDETFNYNSGIVNATAAHGYAIYVEDGNYNFSWRNAADRITIGTTGLGTEDGFTATFTRLFTDADGNYYGGTLTGTDALATLAGKTISGTAELVLANAADNSARIAAANGMSGLDVKLDGRTLYKDGAWNTLCLPFNATLTGDLANATLMELDTEGTYDNGKKTGLDGTTLYLNFKNATSIEAGKPYIIKWDGTYIGDPIVNPTFTGVTINNSASTEVIFTGGSFKGTYKPIVWNEENKSILFLGDNNTLYWPKPEGDNMPHLNAFRAYFELIDVNGVREIKLNYGDEEITAVANSQLSTLNSTLSEWYDMQGRKVSKPTKKGMYIHKGSKVVIK